MFQPSAPKSLAFLVGASTAAAASRCIQIILSDGSNPMSPDRGSRVRTGLTAGGRWIRTIGTPEREAYFFPGRNSLAGTASRRGRDVGSNGQRSVRTATSAMAPSGNRPFSGSAFWRVRMPVGAGQQVAAASLVRPIFTGAPGLDRIGAVAPVAGLDLALRQVLDSGRPAAALRLPHSRRTRLSAV